MKSISMKTNINENQRTKRPKMTINEKEGEILR